MEHLMKWELAEETEVLGETLTKFHFVHRRSYVQILFLSLSVSAVW
jgi:hypothetical protein